MESESAAIDQLNTVDALRLAGYREAARDPIWVWPVVGVFAGAFIASFHWNSPLVTAIATGAYLIGVIGLVLAVVARRGVQPRVNGMPSPLRREMNLYAVGVGVVVLSVMAVGFGVSWLLAGALAFLATAIGGTVYHLRWRAAVEGLEVR